MSLGFPTRSGTNQAVPPQKMARGLKFKIYEVGELYYLCSKDKSTDQMIWDFIFAYAKSRFSQNGAQMKIGPHQHVLLCLIINYWRQTSDYAIPLLKRPLSSAVGRPEQLLAFG